MNSVGFPPLPKGRGLQPTGKMNNFPVIGIVGLQASGKTEVASKLTELGAARVRMGDVVWREVKERELEVTEENVAEAANKLREKEGMDAIAKHCIPIIKKVGEKKDAVVVDGVRGIAEVKKFKEEFGSDFYLLSIEAPEKNRYERIKERKREDDIADLETFRKKDKRELEWGLGDAMKVADYKIENEGSLKELKEETSEIFREIMDKYEN